MWLKKPPDLRRIWYLANDIGRFLSTKSKFIMYENLISSFICFCALNHTVITNKQIAPKLIDQLKLLEEKLSSKDYENVVYGTIDTWILWNATKEKMFLTDITSATCSGFYDFYLVR